MKPLPYAMDALIPFFSQDQLSLHYNNHYKNYVNKLNKLIESAEKAKSGGKIEELVDLS